MLLMQPNVHQLMIPTPLANLFWHEGSSHIRQLPNAKGTKDFRIQHTLAKYLGMAELKGLRLQNKFCNSWVIDSPYFQKSGKISDSWYKQTVGCNTDTPICWTKFHITHFIFRRGSNEFPRYLLRTTMSIKELKLSHSTLGSLALSCILNSCRNMESLKLDAVRLRDIDKVSDYDNDNPLLLEHTIPKNDTDDTAHLNEATRIRKAFLHLTISNTFIMDEISAVHLMDRSQYLQSVCLINCLKDEANSYDPTKHINRGISLHKRGETFMTCIADLLTANQNSLTRLVIDDCNIHVRDTSHIEITNRILTRDLVYIEQKIGRFIGSNT